MLYLDAARRFRSSNRVTGRSDARPGCDPPAASRVRGAVRASASHRRSDDPIVETLVHGFFLSLAVLGAAKQEHLVLVGSAADLDLQAGADLVPPALLDELALPLAEFTPRRADEVLAPAGSQPFEVGLARHATVHDPDPLGLAVLPLHLLDDLLDRRDA